MKDGQILQWDTPFNLYHEPANRFVADFIGQGFFAKHLRRMRRLYARRQRDFVAVCRSRLDRWLTVNEIDTGMQVIGRFKQSMNDAEVLTAARRHGVDFLQLSTQYRHSAPEHGMLLGYAGVGREQMLIGVERLLMAFEDLEQSP
jgi:GntR family transcriptional regulator/MocR family aminotransferase